MTEQSSARRSRTRCSSFFRLSGEAVHGVTARFPITGAADPGRSPLARRARCTGSRPTGFLEKSARSRAPSSSNWLPDHPRAVAVSPHSPGSCRRPLLPALLGEGGRRTDEDCQVLPGGGRTTYASATYVSFSRPQPSNRLAFTLPWRAGLSHMRDWSSPRPALAGRGRPSRKRREVSETRRDGASCGSRPRRRSCGAPHPALCATFSPQATSAVADFAARKGPTREQASWRGEGKSGGGACALRIGDRPPPSRGRQARPRLSAGSG